MVVISALTFIDQACLSRQFQDRLMTGSFQKSHNNYFFIVHGKKYYNPGKEFVEIESSTKPQ